MELRQLGKSDLQITPLGVGAWAIGGGGWKFGWGPQDDQASVGAIRAALEAGINWIDTAAVYGLGHSEEIVARALDGFGKKPYVFTKCERVWNEQGEISGSLKAASIRREVEASLRRLKLDVIDLYQVHWPEPDADIEEGWTEMARLREEGKVRWIGVSNFSVAQMKRAPAHDPLFGTSDIRADGRATHPVFLMQANTPQESKGDWDYFKLVSVIPPDQAYRPLKDGGCKLAG